MGWERTEGKDIGERSEIGFEAGGEEGSDKIWSRSSIELIGVTQIKVRLQ